MDVALLLATLCFNIHGSDGSNPCDKRFPEQTYAYMLKWAYLTNSKDHIRALEAIAPLVNRMPIVSK